MRNHVREMALLVSVRNVDEACDALAGGADWIDLKEPAAAALGAVEIDLARAVVGKLEGRCPLSAAMGELKGWHEAMAGSLIDVPSIDVVKLGLAGCRDVPHWQERWLDVWVECHDRGKQLAAVVYADWEAVCAPSPEAVLKCAAHAGSKYLLIDTFCKTGMSSLEILGVAQAARLLQSARESGLCTVLAGGLRAHDLNEVVQLPVDIVAIRGAACHEDRRSRLDPLLVRKFRTLLTESITGGQDLNSCLTTVS